MNVFIRELSLLCREQRLREKWLVAPSLRVGHQWLDQVTRAGQPVVNVRVKTLRSLALDLAAPRMAQQGVAMLRGKSGPLLAERVWQRLKQEMPFGYLTQLNPSLGLFEMIDSALQTLRLAKLEVADLSPKKFEVAAKGTEFQFLLRAYQEELRAQKWVDYAEVLGMATERVRDDLAGIPAVLLLEPSDLEWTKLEAGLLETFPEKMRLKLKVDRPVAALSKVDIFQAIGEINEVREVLRRCLVNGWGWDEVELLPTDAETYVPLIYELSERFRYGEAGQENIGVTFAEGLPVRYSRPGRALAAWARWVEDEYPQSILVQMIQDGLLTVDGEGGEAASFAELASALRLVPIGFGCARYLPKIEERIACLQRQWREPRRDEEGEVLSGRREAAHGQAELLLKLRPAIESLLNLSSPPTRTAVWDCAKSFLTKIARSVTELDNLARDKLQESLQDLCDWDTANGQELPPSLSAWKWMEGILGELRVRGEGPQPGKLHVAHVLSGGQSGRAHLFIVGLDDGRFPGAGLQDALLLDEDRQKLSRDLPTSLSRRDRKLEQYQLLLGRWQGEVTLSFSVRGLTDDREMFPSAAVLEAYRAVSGQLDADPTALLKNVAKISFAPKEPALCLDMAEWWLWRLSGEERLDHTVELVGNQYPHLARGWNAEKQRQSDAFTEFDGNVPEAGEEMNPMKPGGPVMSSGRLQAIGACPLRFFFKYVLKLETPNEGEREEDEWLNGLDVGSLMHSVFCEFMVELVRGGRRPHRATDWPRLETILNTHLRIECERIPPPSQNVFTTQANILRRMAERFLIEEEEFCKTSEPRFMEASLGMKSEGTPTPLDCQDPIPVGLADGRQIYCRGRLDRLDEIAPGEFVIWDYKTGGTHAQETKKEDGFRHGRLVQHYLYLKMAQNRLGENGRVEKFGFFFPSNKEKGKRLMFCLQDLSRGNVVLQHLAQTVANGAFLATPDAASDCKFCDYRKICCDVTLVAKRSEGKMAKSADPKLKPFCELRSSQEKE